MADKTYDELRREVALQLKQHERDLAMGRGEDKLNFIIVALFPFSGPDVSSQEALDNMRDGSGSLSIKALVEADRTLGGACTSLRVTTLSRPSMYACASARVMKK